MSLWSRLVNLVRQDCLTRELDEEMEAHIAEAVEQGRPEEEARRAFGPSLRWREESRDIKLVPWLDSLRADVVFGSRQLRKNGVASWAAVLSLALAMGACVSAFRLVDALLFRPLPVAHPERLFVLTFPYTDPDGSVEVADSFDYPQFRALRAAVQGHAELFAITRPNRNALTFGSGENAERFARQSVSGWTFAALGLRPALGRLLTSADDVTPGAHPVAVISYDYWNRRFGRDPAVVGRRFRMGNDQYEIVGVTEEAFTGTEPGLVTDVFLPTMMNASAIDNPRWSWFRIWVRVLPGHSPGAVREQLRAAVAAWRAERVKTWPADTPSRAISEYLAADVSLDPASAGVSPIQRDYRRPLFALGVLVFLVLLIACANVANLMTAQGSARAREMALRVSIGAGRRRLAQLVLVESTIVAVLASALGVAFAWWAAPFVVSRISQPDFPVRLVLPFDWRFAGFAAALTLGVAALFGLLPAVRAAAVPSMTVLRGGDNPRNRRRTLNVLLAAQVAFCFVVLLVASLFVATFDRLSHQPTGFVADRLFAVETVTRGNVRRPLTTWEEVRQHLESVAGVESAAFCGWALMTQNSWSDNVRVNGGPTDDRDVYFLAVSPGWLKTMRIPLVAGRDLTSRDAYAGAAIVNHAFARRYFGGINPVGRTFDSRVADALVPSAIVGYAGDARYRDMREPVLPTVYVPFSSEGRVPSSGSQRRSRPGTGLGDLHGPPVVRRPARHRADPEARGHAGEARVPRRERARPGRARRSAPRARAPARHPVRVLRVGGAAARGRRDVRIRSTCGWSSAGATWAFESPWVRPPGASSSRQRRASSPSWPPERPPASPPGLPRRGTSRDSSTR